MAFITPPKPRERTPVNVEANAPYNYDDFLTPPEGRYENKYSIYINKNRNIFEECKSEYKSDLRKVYCLK